MINIDYRDPRSIYEQIEGGFRELIIKGVLAPGEQLPSVRELSISLTVNPNTVQRAYKQLELEGYVYSIKGKGSFVSEANDVKSAQNTKPLYEALERTLQELMFLGEEKRTIQELLDKIYSQRRSSSDTSK